MSVRRVDRTTPLASHVMAVADDDVVAVREATDLVALISERVQLKRVGRRFVGLCPFHGEKSPSFNVNHEQGRYYCFGCHAKGDSITWIRETEHCDFVEAIERLATRAGITLKQVDERAGRERARRKQLTEIMQRAVDFFHTRLLSADDAAPARSYLRQRGYDGDVVRKYFIGWAPDDWDALAKYLGVSEQLLTETGLGFVNRRGRQQDAFRARVMFPIFDVSNNPVAFGGRILGQSSEGQPKYKNSQESTLYSKRKTLYALNWAKEDIVRAGEVVVVEGYTDVIGFGQAGLPRAVATCGTALADEHVKLLRGFTRRIVLAYDADAAGQAAAERFYEWERTHDLELFVAELPDGSDPADVARTNPEGLAAAVANAMPFLGFRVRRVLRGGPMNTPEARARAADRALAIVAEHPTDLVRDQYVMEVASATQIDPELLRRRLRAGTKGATSSQPSRSMGAVRDSRRVRQQGPEAELVRLAIGDPEAVVTALLDAAADVDTSRDLLDALADALFVDDVYLAAFRLLARSATFHDAVDTADPTVADLLTRMAVEETEATVNDVLALLIIEASRRRLNSTQGGRIDGVEDYVLANKESAEAKHAIEAIREGSDPSVGIRRLVPWLVRAGETS